MNVTTRLVQRHYRLLLITYKIDLFWNCLVNGKGIGSPLAAGYAGVESLLIVLECQVIEGSGSRVTFILNGQRTDFHRPHPGKEALRYRVKDVRKFLQRAGVTP